MQTHGSAQNNGNTDNKAFKNIIDYAREGDLFVFNDTKVFPARLRGNKEKTGAEIEISLLRELNREQRLWDVLVDPARKIRIGNKLYFGDDDSLVAEVIDNTTSRGRTLRFLYDGSYDDFKRTLFSVGELPIQKKSEVIQKRLIWKDLIQFLQRMKGLWQLRHPGCTSAESFLKDGNQRDRIYFPYISHRAWQFCRSRRRRFVKTQNGF